MSNRHPTYPHPTIIEAVCDIHFRLPETKAWKPSLPGELFKHIQDEYPEMEPVLEMGLPFEFVLPGAGTKVSPQFPKVHFKHRTRTIMLQLSENSFSISTLPPYQGWETMRTDALAAWRQAEDVLQPVAIYRLGVRYINQFAKKQVRTVSKIGLWQMTTSLTCYCVLAQVFSQVCMFACLLTMCSW